ncbi:MAG: NUDIX hydrolase [Nocardioides sp.]
MSEPPAFRSADATPGAEPDLAVEPRDAASVVLLRGGPEGIELYLMVRHAAMAFAPGVAVFPGGGVGAADHAPLALDRRDWSGLLGVPADRARAVVRAAIRETREETGVSLSAGQLTPWACWVTPEASPRRYRTWFFLAALPSDQEARDISGEAERASWLTPRAALSRFVRGDLSLWPPQAATCAELIDARSPDQAVAIAEIRRQEARFPAARFSGDHDHLDGTDRVAALLDRVTAGLDS